jgi:5-methylcytosine-specific restriction protein A
MSSAKNNSWDKEEVILLIELYLNLKDQPYTLNHSGLSELSKFLNKRAISLGLKVSNSFRNNTGIFMKLKNIQALDSSSKSGLTNYSSMDKSVWDEYCGNKDLLKGICKVIRSKY